MGRDKLKTFTKILLDKNQSDDKLEAVVKQLATLFEENSCINKENNESFYIESALSNGLALSPDKAALCALEPLRVSYFLRGIYKAINDVLSNPSETVNILYAGSGPYGTLLIPLLPFFSSKDIQVTILDYHQTSLDSVKNIVGFFDLDEYIKDYVQADASVYKYPKDEPLHVVISETMTASLQKEMQVPITLNLSPQLIDGGVFIPENIALKGIYLNPKEAFIQMGSDAYWDKDKVFATVFEINKQKGIEYNFYLDKEYIPANKIALPKDIQKDFHPFLLTEITVYDDIKMDGFQCSLNHLLSFPSDGLEKKDSELELVYNLGENPGISLKKEYSYE